MNLEIWKNQSDREIIDQYKQCSMEAITAFIIRYNHKMVGLCLRILKNEDDKNEVIQKIAFHFLNAELQQKQGYFSIIGREPNYLMTTTTNNCLNLIKDNKWYVDEEKIDKNLHQPTDLWYEYKVELLLQAIEKLDDETKAFTQVFRRYDTRSEIMNALNINRNRYTYLRDKMIKNIRKNIDDIEASENL